MRHFLKVFDYIFFRSYLFFSSHRVFKGMEKIDAITVIYLIWFFPICCILGYISHRIGVRFFVKYEETYYIAIVIALLGYIPIERRYLRKPEITKDDYQSFRNRWGKETNKQKKIRGWLIVWLLILILILPIIFIVLMRHHFL